ncbi:MAG TPA: hypothetical protein VI322_02540 [Candidatus Saccharimonadia bacterium]
MNETSATDATKTALENSVNWFLSDKLQDAGTSIATKKYLTADNQLVYLTRLNTAEPTIPKVKIQQFVRVDHGVREAGYQLFGDHRFLKYTNEMIFGTQPNTAAGNQTEDVSEAEAADLLNLVNSLTTARQTL